MEGTSVSSFIQYGQQGKQSYSNYMKGRLRKVVPNFAKRWSNVWQGQIAMYICVLQDKFKWTILHECERKLSSNRGILVNGTNLSACPKIRTQFTTVYVNISTCTNCSNFALNICLFHIDSTKVSHLTSATHDLDRQLTDFHITLALALHGNDKVKQAEVNNTFFLNYRCTILIQLVPCLWLFS